ncbi:hypothetical protein [Jatrophihabitans sp.]|uniref:hypothetical protein n=1 Tax=Jatrophihabitans sp. TaxID=1932789 RepID=UPI0030C7612E
MTEAEAERIDAEERFNFNGSIGVALLVAAVLGWTTRTGALPLLIGIAAVQALLGFAWVFGLAVPGRRGALILAALASAAADVTVSVWPHSQLGTLLAVFGLAMPTLFVHQLSRGAVRVRVIESLGGVALLVLTEVSLPALLQLRHEFVSARVGDDVSFGVVIIGFGALVVGFLVDMIVAAPRFDVEVPRGLLALLASTGFGGSAGYLTLRHSAEFIGGRGAFAGAALGAVVGLFGVAVAFIEHEVPLAEGGFARRVRPVLAVLIPFCLLAPVAFLLCLAIRA